MKFLTNLALDSVIRWAVIGTIAAVVGWATLTYVDYRRVKSELQSSEEMNELLKGQINQLSEINSSNLVEFDREIYRRELAMEAAISQNERERTASEEIEDIKNENASADDYFDPIDGVLLDTIERLRDRRSRAGSRDARPVSDPSDTP